MSADTAEYVVRPEHASVAAHAGSMPLIDQITRMRDQKMISVTTGRLNAGPARRHTMIVHPLGTAGAFSAANPGTYQPVLAERNVRGVGAGCDDGTVWLMAECDWWLHSTIAHEKALAATHIKIAVADMYIAVANTAVLEFEQYFGAFRLRCWMFTRCERFAPLNDVVAQHFVFPCSLNHLYAKSIATSMSCACDRRQFAKHSMTTSRLRIIRPFV